MSRLPSLVQQLRGALVAQPGSSALGGAAAALGSAGASAASVLCSSQQRRQSSDLAIRGVDAVKAGPGGRSSVSGVTATIFGCSGFLARYVANALGNTGGQLVLPYRCDDTDVQHLRVMGDLGQVVMLPNFSIRDDEFVRQAISRSNIVINMVGAAQETWNYKFEEVHIEWPARLARLVKESGRVERFIHLSCLGAEADAPSRRLRTKAAGEEVVRGELGPLSTIFKPAAMTGTEDRLFNLYAAAAKRTPFLPLVNGGRTRMQPVWVRDVAAAIMNSLKTYDAKGQTYYLAGPDVMTVAEQVDFMFRTIRENNTSLPVPAAVAAPVARLWDWLGSATPLRGPLMFSSDYIAEMKGDYVLPSGVLGFEHLDIVPHKVTEGLPIEYLRFYRSGGYDFGSLAEEGEAANAPALRHGWLRGFVPSSPAEAVEHGPRQSDSAEGAKQPFVEEEDLAAKPFIRDSYRDILKEKSGTAEDVRVKDEAQSSLGSMMQDPRTVEASYARKGWEAVVPHGGKERESEDDAVAEEVFGPASSSSGPDPTTEAGQSRFSSGASKP